MYGLPSVFRSVLSSIALGSLACLCAEPLWADAIRVDKTWYQDVYITETPQFYVVLFPKDGTTQQISKKRQDISTPQLSKDPAERTKLKSQWEKASEERKNLEARELELRTKQTKLSNRQDGAPRMLRKEPSAAERAAEQAAWQAKLAERQAAMEERERLLDERAGIVHEDEQPTPADNAAETQVEPGQEQDGQPVPPGPRAKPEQAAGPAGAQQPGMSQQQPMAPGGDAQQEQARMQAEAYYWDQINSQGYAGSDDGFTPLDPVSSTMLNSYTDDGR